MPSIPKTATPIDATSTASPANGTRRKSLSPNPNSTEARKGRTPRPHGHPERGRPRPHGRRLGVEQPQPKDQPAEPSSLTNKSVRVEAPGVVFFGTSTYAAEEALDLLAAEGIHLDAMRVRAFPFGKAVSDFVDDYDKLFVIEQNRDAQFKSLMMIELGIDAARLISVLNYDGTPITADDILVRIKKELEADGE